MNQIRLPQIINEAMAIQKSQAIVDAGTMISGMILNLLSDAKIRLYRRSQFFEDKPMPFIFPWKPDLDSYNFTEERAGNVLDDFYRSNPQKVFSMLTHSNIKLYDINTSSIRVDTTSKNFYGAYETNRPEPICERIFGDPLTYSLRIHVQKCGYQFISAFERRRVLDTPELTNSNFVQIK